MLEIKQVILEGKYVLLRPPSNNDLEELSSAAQDGEIWNNPYALFPTPQEMSEYLQNHILQRGVFLSIGKQRSKGSRQRTIDKCPKRQISYLKILERQLVNCC
jgi:hypothetical protein